jgi:hypothetical protein
LLDVIVSFQFVFGEEASMFARVVYACGSALREVLGVALGITVFYGIIIPIVGVLLVVMFSYHLVWIPLARFARQHRAS